MARSSAPDSATSQFFVNLADNVNLDTQGGGYAVFGTITSGTAVVEAMRAAACIETLFLFAGECLPVHRTW
jgi:cyclophilin family peptidyl-prolyl cis-trans isomerase